MIGAVLSGGAGRNPELRGFPAHPPDTRQGGLEHFRMAVADEPHAPDAVFNTLRWGGQFAYASTSARQVRHAADAFAQNGFAMLSRPQAVREGRIKIPLLSRKYHYFVARKVTLVQPAQTSDRFTYQVELLEPRRPGAEWTVLKQVPATERVAARLRKRFPDVSEDVILKRSRKFTEKIFPVFLTREAAILKILQRDLPAAYSRRVPRVLAMETDEHGLVRKLRMNWLRGGSHSMSQLEFARQATQLLHVLHDTVGVIHLDLRLDNIVITEQGVGFVDFGSSVRLGENLAANPMVHTLFGELMRTSEIQRMLERMTLSGSVTSPILSAGLQKVDKAVDFFNLAVQINTPLDNPDFGGLVAYDPAGNEAASIRRLTDEVLRPTDVRHPRFRNASDLLHGIQQICDGRDPVGV
jgi:tRNA A-37 threonylcarbamoyl transferase component Bud32